MFCDVNVSVLLQFKKKTFQVWILHFIVNKYGKFQSK